MAKGPDSKHVCFPARLATRPNALRPCARHQEDCHDNWLWPLVMLHCAFCARPRRATRWSASSGHRTHTHRVFVTTRAGTDTMARRRQGTDEDEITEADDTAGAATFGGGSIRDTGHVTQPSMPADLRTVLAMPTTFVPTLFEIISLHAVSTACKVKDTGDLCSFVTGFLRSSGPPRCGL